MTAADQERHEALAQIIEHSARRADRWEGLNTARSYAASARAGRYDPRVHQIRRSPIYPLVFGMTSEEFHAAVSLIYE